ncbi:MAG: alginate export family protein [Candidatus Omnitrophica bacterium]|nr:alginate export family protein [Candidatus Omnitrophota bacterium]
MAYDYQKLLKKPVMKKVVVYVCVVAAASLCVAASGRADEISDLKEQLKTMQQQMELMRDKIEKLESEKTKAMPGVLEQRLVSLEEKVAKKPAAWADKIRLYGSLWEYYVSQDSSYFGTTSSYGLESIAKIGVEATLSENISANILLTAQNAIGDPGDFTGVTTDDWVVEPELANLVYKNILDSPLSMTVGRQNLKFGDGFLICDGYPDSRAAWSAPIASFYAIKAAYEDGPIKLEGFAAMPDQDYKSYETYLTDATARTGKRLLYGTNLHLEKEKYGAWDLGIFFKDDDSVLQSDTLAISQRWSYPFDFWPDSKFLPQLTIEGEIVEEMGRTKVKDYALTGSRQDRLAIGGHMDTKLSFTKIRFSPYLKGSYIYLPGDDPDTDKNEAFDPMFFGFHSAGKWLIGDINSWSLSNYNEKVIMTELGLSPTKDTLLRGQYFYLALDRPLNAGAGKRWSHEVNIIFDYFPNEWFFSGAEFGYAHPLEAARSYAGDDQDTTEFILWAGVNF